MAVKESDRWIYGEYSCRARNRLGDARINIDIAQASQSSTANIVTVSIITIIIITIITPQVISKKSEEAKINKSKEVRVGLSRSSANAEKPRDALCQLKSWASCSHLHVCASVTKQYNLISLNGRWCSVAGKVTAGLAESNGSLPPGGWLIVTCGLTACTRGTAPGPTLGNEYGKLLPCFMKPGPLSCRIAPGDVTSCTILRLWMLSYLQKSVQLARICSQWIFYENI